MKLSDVFVVFVVFLGLFIETLQYSAYIAIVGDIVNNNNNKTYNIYVGLLFSCHAIGYLLSINLSYKFCIFFGYFIPMIIGSFISIWFTLLFSWNLNSYYMLIICRLITAFGTTFMSTSGWCYILYQFDKNIDINKSNKINNMSPHNYSNCNNPTNCNNDNCLNLRNFVANISYLSVSIAWIIGPFLSTFLYSFPIHITAQSQHIEYLPFYALVGIMALHLFLFLFTTLLSCTKSKNIKLFCLKNCCICYYCNITCKYITMSPFNCNCNCNGCNLKWHCFDCPTFLKRSISRKYLSRPRHDSSSLSYTSNRRNSESTSIGFSLTADKTSEANDKTLGIKCSYIANAIKKCFLFIFCCECGHRNSSLTSCSSQSDVNMTVTMTSSDNNNNGYIYPKPAAYHRPFYGGAVASNYQYRQTAEMQTQKETEHSPLKNNHLICIDNISSEIYNGLQGDSFWSVLFGNNIYIFLLIGCVIICNCCIVYIQLLIPYIIDKNINEHILQPWQYGLVYIPIQIILFIFYPLIIKCLSCSTSHKIYLLIIGLVLLSLSTSAITLIYDIYILFIVCLFLGLSMAVIFATFSQIIQFIIIKKSMCKRRKPVLLILTIATRFGYIIGSLIGAKVSQYFGKNNTLLIFAAGIVLYSPFLISLLRETNHNSMLLVENESSEDENCENKKREQLQETQHLIPISNNNNKVQMVDSD